MTAPTPYSWAFERHTEEFHPQALTFSVGVFQWLPKSSGKGLKKSKTVRVVGFVLEPERVYDKAAELCEQLNASEARIDDPPPWLQKQYSVPKPDGLVIERISNDLTGPQVRSIRLKVVKEYLLPAGFLKSTSGAYVRKQGNQVHLVDFQAAMFGHKYTVNLGFHYDFLPGFFAGKKIPWNDYHLLDCALNARIGYLAEPYDDTWYDYGTDRDALRLVLIQNVRDCLQAFDVYAKNFVDPRRWLKDASFSGQLTWLCEEKLLLRACIAVDCNDRAAARRFLEQRIGECEIGRHQERYRQWMKCLQLD